MTLPYIFVLATILFSPICFAKTAPQTDYPACPINHRPQYFCVESNLDGVLHKSVYTLFNIPSGLGSVVDQAYLKGWGLSRKINFPYAEYTPSTPAFQYNKDKICRLDRRIVRGKLVEQIACVGNDKHPFHNQSLLLDSMNNRVYMTYTGNPRNNNATFPVGSTWRSITLPNFQLDTVAAKMCKSASISVAPKFTTYIEAPFLALYLIYGCWFLLLVLWYIYKQFSSSYKEVKKDTKQPLLASIHSNSASNLESNRGTSIRASELMIQHSQEDIIQVGYNNSIFGTVVLWLLGVLTLGLNILLFVLIFDLYEVFQPPLFQEGEPRLSIFLVLWSITTVWFALLVIKEGSIVNFFRVKCSLDSCQYVHMFKPEYTEILLKDRTHVSDFVARMENLLFPKAKTGYQATVLVGKSLVDKADDFSRFLEFQHLRYVYCGIHGRFIPSTVPLGITFADLHCDSGGLSVEEYRERLQMVGPNSIEIQMPTIFESIVAEFFSFFYIYQIMCYYVWFYFSYWKMGLVMTIVVFSSAAINIISKRGMQSSVVQMSKYFSNVRVCRNSSWKTTPSTDLVPGDLVEVQENWILPCDMVIVQGSTVCDESMLTGESMPVQKSPIPHDDTQVYDAFGTGKKHTLFSGAKVLSSGRNEQILAMVQTTGAHTSKGQLIQSILFPIPMKFKYDEHLKVVLTVLFVYGIIACYFVVYFLSSNEKLDNRLNAWCYCIFMLSSIMSPLLPVVITVGQVNASKRLAKIGVSCLNSQRITLSGKIRVFCFDKTGTLTKEGLDFLGCVPVKKSPLSFYPNTVHDLNEQNAIHEDLQFALASCHSLGSLEGTLVGNQVEVKMFAATGWNLLEEEDQPVIVQSPDGKHQLKVVKRYEFDHHRMSMSVVMRDLKTGLLHVFCKGSYEKIEQISTRESLPKDYQEKAQQFSCDGCYVLGISHATFDESTSRLDELINDRDALESKLNFLGLILFRNELKSDTKDAIAQLVAGDTRVVMITGDNAMCGSYIARASGMITATAKVILGDVSSVDSVKDNTRVGLQWFNVDTNEKFSTEQIEEMVQSDSDIELALTGRAFDRLIAIGKMESLLFHTRIFSRMTPDGKVQCVKMHMEKGAVTGMCGDGGNDCGALRVAHAGIALSEAEASIVAPFTSKQKSISSVVDLCREGRCSVATSFASVKFLIMYGLVGSTLRFTQYYNGFVLCEWANIITDGFILVGLSYFITLSQPLPTLDSQRPTSSLIGYSTLLSILGQEIINVIFMLFGLYFLTSQAWYCPFNPANVDLSKWWLLGDNALATCTFYLVVFQQQTGAFVFSFGSRFRQPIWKNYGLCGFYCVLFFLDVFFILAEPNALTDAFRIASSTNVVGLPDIPLSFEFRLNFFFIVLGNFFAVWIYEYFVILGPVRSYLREKYYCDYLHFKL